MSPIPRFGLSELVILAGVTGLACMVPAIGAAVLAAIFFQRRKAHPAEQE